MDGSSPADASHVPAACMERWVLEELCPYSWWHCLGQGGHIMVSSYPWCAAIVSPCWSTASACRLIVYHAWWVGSLGCLSCLGMIYDR